MEDGYLTVATRHSGASANKFSMQNRLRFIQLVQAQHFVEVLESTAKVAVYQGLERHHRRKRRV